MGYEILYCAQCRVQLRGREFERGEAFRIDVRAVCKKCAPVVIKSLPEDQVQLLLKQMVLAQGARSANAAPPPAERKAAGPRIPSLVPLWAGLALVSLLVLGLAGWVFFRGPSAAAPSSPPSVSRESAVRPASSTVADPPAKAPAAPKAPELPAAPGLVGHWKLDEGAGTSAIDASGHQLQGLLVNGPAWVPGKQGTALSFDGQKAVVNMEAGKSLANLYKSGLTVCAWISRGSAKRGNLVDKSNSNVGWILSLNVDAKLHFAGDQFRGSELILISSKIIPPNSWRHVAATWDGSSSASRAHLYIDGLLADGTATDGKGELRDDDAATPLSIGNRRRLDRGFDGLIDDVRIYNRVLSAAEILGLGTEK